MCVTALLGLRIHMAGYCTWLFLWELVWKCRGAVSWFFRYFWCRLRIGLQTKWSDNTTVPPPHQYARKYPVLYCHRLSFCQHCHFYNFSFIIFPSNFSLNFCRPTNIKHIISQHGWCWQGRWFPNERRHWWWLGMGGEGDANNTNVSLSSNMIWYADNKSYDMMLLLRRSL